MVTDSNFSNVSLFSSACIFRSEAAASSLFNASFFAPWEPNCFTHDVLLAFIILATSAFFKFPAPPLLVPPLAFAAFPALLPAFAACAVAAAERQPPELGFRPEDEADLISS